MTRGYVKVLVCTIVCAFIIGCAGQKNEKRFDAEKLDQFSPEEKASMHELKGYDSKTLNPDTMNLDTYMEELVDNFIVILDASGSKYLPYKQQVKLKVAKDIARRFNQKVPDRPLTSGLRRYGWEAGAFTTKTELIYGMTQYTREGFGDAIEILQWAGGKTPMALAIDESTKDFEPVVGLMALVIISDGKVLLNDSHPVQAAKRMKERYGDRLCIYTVAVGDDIPFDETLYHNKEIILTDIAKVGGCGYMVRADELESDEAMTKFADDVFNRRYSLKPKERELAKGPCIDTDVDGVCDEVDECPDTPKGAKVDERGCWVIDMVHFDLDKWNIKPEYYSVIDEVVRVMKLNSDLTMEIDGHTCTIWTEEYNKKLSNWRAMSVTSYMVKKGISSNRLVVKGFGYQIPMASNATEETRKLNRRAEFKPSRR